MIDKLGLFNNTKSTYFGANVKTAPVTSSVEIVNVSPLAWFLSGGVKNTSKVALAPVSVKLTTAKDTKMYNEIVKAFATSDSEKTSPVDNVSRQKKLDALLKNGTLLNDKSNDKTSVLESIHKTINDKRAGDLSGLKIAGQIIDTIYNPTIITQKFGDIPKEAEVFIKDADKHYIKQADALNQEGSGTCVAASVEFHMANKHPAEFARWAESLTSPKIDVEKNIDLSALSKNTMDALWLIKEFEVDVKGFNFYRPNLILKPDNNAIVRAKIQDNFWDKGERSILDVLFQSTLMNIGSEQTYDSLTDTRAGKFSTNNQGLIEFEKTFIESIVENSERTSVVYQNLDNDQNLIGWNVGFDVIQKHITDAIDMGQDIIAGCIATAQECGETGVNPNKVVGGHEITITNYRKDKNGDVIFICNDTDDNKENFVEYKATELLPKIHHASYPVELVES